ncbi:MAG: RNA 3'-phosphate cyclase [Candidatus Aenigmarchaeota archaeon]|nr:RNA 3'-phosphate cyclase [Candidatus Aenigmarchaeota archaeon]
MPESVEIDGSHGEGGGSIIRSAVALSAVTGKPCKITGIRTKRENPGLQAQHAAAVHAVAKLCGADVKGNEIGSTEIEFMPGEIKGGSLSLNIGTAGSAALVLQALMLPAMHCEKPVDIQITGGTMNKWAPSIDYLQNVTLATLARFGYEGELKLLRHGFYPKGGGMVEATMRKAELMPVVLTERGRFMSLKGTSTASKELEQGQVAERMQRYAREHLYKVFHETPEVNVAYVDAHSPGGGIDLCALYEHAVLGSGAIAERAKRAEDVAKEAVDALVASHRSGAPVDKHLADQLIPYMALAKGSSAIRAEEITEHTRTNIWVCGHFVKTPFRIDEKEKQITCG